MIRALQGAIDGSTTKMITRFNVSLSIHRPLGIRHEA